MKPTAPRLSQKVALVSIFGVLLILTTLSFREYKREGKFIRDSSFEQIEAIALTLSGQIDPQLHEKVAGDYTIKDQIQASNLPEEYRQLASQVTDRLFLQGRFSQNLEP